MLDIEVTMSAVEIYVCAKGQALKEGKVTYSQSIYDKKDAQDDAEARVKRNAKIHRIAYYKINDEGDFKMLYSYTNKALNAPPKVEASAPKKRKRKKPLKKPFWKRWLGLS
ncbi:MAG: hypothetical protein COB59_09410 [Rhodospirillaceae bacterium]|nr:MAG: hypothetical protein COB59_09410 [Rhodospirillaceae bacterium]